MPEKIATVRAQGWLEKMKKTLVESGLDAPTVHELLSGNPKVNDVIARMSQTGLDKKTIRDILMHAGVKAEAKIKATDTISDPHPEAEKHKRKFSDREQKLMVALVTILSFAAGYIWGGYIL